MKQKHPSIFIFISDIAQASAEFLSSSEHYSAAWKFHALHQERQPAITTLSIILFSY